MKVLFIDTAGDGHHDSYINGIVNNIQNCEFVAIYPKKISCIAKVYELKLDLTNKSLSNYVKFLSLVKRVIKLEKPDVVHFLYGDYLYRFFGIGLGRIYKKQRFVITYHHIRRGFLLDLSIKRLFGHSTVGIVHTESLKQDLNDMSIENVALINYPSFNKISEKCKEEIRGFWGIKSDAKVISSLGATRYDKGVDILLDALKKVEGDFVLLLAGKPTDFDESFIKEKISCYSEKVKLIPRFLSDEEMADFVKMSDIIVLPYRFVFDGASGPLVEAVANGKCIVGPNHGSLGQIIERNSLGYTFETENSESLAKAIDLALKENFEPNEKYIGFRELLTPKGFGKMYGEIYLDKEGKI